MVAPAPQAAEFKHVEDTLSKEQSLRRWNVHSAQMRSKLRVPDDFRPWTTTASLHGVPPVPRVRELLDLGYILVLKEAQRKALAKRNPVPYDPTAMLQGYWADLSQAVQRRPFGGLPTSHTHSFFYSYPAYLVLPGMAHSALHGFPQSLDWSCFGASAAAQSAAARQLVGEAWSVPCGAQAMVAAFLTSRAPWWGPDV